MNSRTRRYLPDLARIAALLLLTSAAQGADPTASIETAVVRRLPMDIRLESYGTLQPDPDALTSINLPRAGLVNRLLVAGIRASVYVRDPLKNLAEWNRRHPGANAANTRRQPRD